MQDREEQGGGEGQDEHVWKHQPRPTSARTRPRDSPVAQVDAEAETETLKIRAINPFQSDCKIFHFLIQNFRVFVQFLRPERDCQIKFTSCFT